MKIAMKNKNGENVGYVLVSKEDYDHLSKFKWYKDGDGYAKSKINNKMWKIHRYIMIEILKNDLTSKQPIDHIDNDKLNNSRTNLRVATFSENARNRKKKENASSIYTGVCFLKYKNKWKTSIKINNKTLHAIYDIEIHAAHQYNLWVDEYDLKSANKNKIKFPEDFVQYIIKPKKENLPRGISKNGNKFKVQVNGKHIGTFSKLTDAEIELKTSIIENEKIKHEKLLATPILYNELNQFIFKVKETEVLIDEDIFHEIIKYKWQIDKQNYIRCKIKDKSTRLHRFILNYTGDDYVDHINGNKLDNRRVNLRVATVIQNNMNKKSTDGSSSQYIGVSFNKRENKWIARITVDGKLKYLGSFSCEIEAAKVRDIATKIYYNNFGRLNFQENLSK